MTEEKEGKKRDLKWQEKIDKWARALALFSRIRPAMRLSVHQFVHQPREGKSFPGKVLNFVETKSILFLLPTFFAPGTLTSKIREGLPRFVSRNFSAFKASLSGFSLSLSLLEVAESQ